MEDYKKRMICEYQQLAGRTDKLSAMLHKWDHGGLDFEPACPYALLRRQLSAMLEYKSILEERAGIEGVELDTYAGRFE